MGFTCHNKNLGHFFNKPWIIITVLWALLILCKYLFFKLYIIIHYNTDFYVHYYYYKYTIPTQYAPFACLFKVSEVDEDY